MRASLLALILTTAAPLLFADTTVYVLKRGDTLYSIARRFDVPLDLLMKANDISDPSRLRTGMTISIPAAAGQYRVERGDTLYSIARRYRTTVAVLRSLNGMKSTDVLRVGQVLRVPSGAASPGSTGAVASTEGGESGRAEAATRSTASRGTPFWPHGGRIEPMEGRLSSAVAIGGIEGDPVVSVSAGKVTWAAPFRGYGQIVFVKADNGVTFGYAGNEELLVRVGDRVSTGTVLARMGTSPHDGEARVIFFATRDERALDPFSAPRS